MNMKKRMRLDILIPLLVVVLFVGLAFTDFYEGGENSVYDLFLHLKPEIPENENILLLDVDDLAIAKVGVWPWSRHIMGDGLILMREFDVAYCVFDIEYTEESPLGVNSSLLEEEIPELFDSEFAYINENISALFAAITSGSISLADAEDFIRDLAGLTENSKGILLDQVRSIARDNDTYLGQAAHFFDNAFFTVNMLNSEDPDVEDRVKEYARDFIALDATVKDAGLQRAVDIRPPVFPIISRAKGAGFPNIIIDSDGVRRKVDLIIEEKGKYFGQLAFRPLLAWLGNPDIIIEKNRIILDNAVLPGEERKDIIIPLTEGEKFLINWPKKDFDNSFRHLSYYYLVLHNRQETNLLHNLKIMEEAGYLSYYEGDGALLDSYYYADAVKQDILNGDDPAQAENYIETRAYFFEELGGFLESDAEQIILSEIDDLLASEELPEEYRETYLEIRESVVASFQGSRDLYGNLMKTRKILAENLPGSFCITGWTGTSTTDRGVNPFDSDYDNVGTHASVVNTILSGLFLDDYPWWYSAIAAVVLSFAVFFIIRNLNPGPSIIIGVVFIAVIIGGAVGYFLLTGRYFAVITPLLSVVFTFLIMTVFKFIKTAQEKSYIRNAFGHYLSSEVINDLLDNPDKLALGGEKKNLTAIFTDIKGFSAISEVLDPGDLVKLLNMYLTEMSDIIMDLGGTIDKYEGDAIISFFGAPVDYPDHAKRACEAAVRMKKAEQRLNQRFLDDKVTPKPLLTRIGINTGEMVVGNMGTAQKMDYTIMGNAVNLASRLEGVNKQYGTWVLMSDITYEDTGEDFVVRKMDKVRVVGISKPVRLYELVDLKREIDKNTQAGIDAFEKAHDLFENKQWEEALAGFEKVLELIPEDGPALAFSKRCKDFIRKPPAESWDGIFNLSMK